ncbi:MAG: ATP-dependent helicase [Chloroflexi bacterium]|nr:MAG: ATP-dependent helicase [Chloroflexota bacterium]TMG46408.1 MAG: ATP-dependent helicase [Chloroflexota bacterium]
MRLGPPRTSRLGREQEQAAALAAGPVRVVAGAGTGKTAVIAERFRRLVATGVSPAAVLVMTFTERAADEMRQRIEDLIEAPAPAVGTFHSIALGWLREDGRSIGVPPGFRILTGADRWILARQLMWSIGDAALTGDERPDDLVAPVLQTLERMKEELVPIARLQAWAASSEDADKAALMRACANLFRAYEKECRKQRFLDFDDLLLSTVRLFEKHPEVLRRYAERYPHVLVDEYQDLNLAQERLVELIAGGGDPFVVGDDDQSIYRFRGASRASLERFLGSFPGARTTTLGRNRRSSRRIVAAATALIANNPDRLSKQLRSEETGPAVQLWECSDGLSEASAIAREAARLVDEGAALASIAVLCRTNAIARPIAAALAAGGLRHVVIGGHGFHDRPEIKDLIAMLRVVRDPCDLIALSRVTARPATAALPSVVERFTAAAGQLDVRDLFFELMEQTRYLEVLRTDLEASEAARATANVSRFAETIAEFCEGSADRSLAAFMGHLDLVLLSGEDEEPAPVEAGDAIQVMTIHQSKGLEFDAVFVPSLVEGRLPQSGRSPRFELPATVLEPLVRGREDVIAEERRLLYVAMTRARRRLYLTRATHYEGGRRWRDSRFLDEVRAAGRGVILERQIAPSPEPPPVASVSGHAGEVQLSYSAITAYQDCPRQYWYRHVQRLPVVQSAEAVHGVILHEVLRRAGELRRKGGAITGAQLKTIHNEVWKVTSFPDPRRVPVFKRNGAAELEAYRAGGGLDAVPAYLEHAFDVAVDGWKLRGVIDRIDRTEGGWRIIDYKSGRPIARRRRDLQVALYALGATSALRLDHLELEVVYLAGGGSVRVDKVDGLVHEAEVEGAQVAEGIRAGRYEPRPERRRCRLCPYRLACADAL